MKPTQKKRVTPMTFETVCTTHDVERVVAGLKALLMRGERRLAPDEKESEKVKDAAARWEK